MNDRKDILEMFENFCSLHCMECFKKNNKIENTIKIILDDPLSKRKNDKIIILLKNEYDKIVSSSANYDVTLIGIDLDGKRYEKVLIPENHYDIKKDKFVLSFEPFNNIDMLYCEISNEMLVYNLLTKSWMNRKEEYAAKEYIYEDKFGEPVEDQIKAFISNCVKTLNDRLDEGYTIRFFEKDNKNIYLIKK